MNIKDAFVKMVAKAKNIGKKILFGPISTEELDKAVKGVQKINADKKMPDSVRTEALKNIINQMKFR